MDRSTDEIERELEGYRLDTRPMTRGHCQRCIQKNRKRLHAWVDERDRTQLVSGEGISALAYGAGGNWRVRDLIHERHPPPLFRAVDLEGAIATRIVANVDLEPGGLYLRNVTVEEHSPPGCGPSKPPARNDKRWGASGWDLPLPLDAPYPIWPPETCQWLDDLLAEHGVVERGLVAEAEEVPADA